MNISIGPHRIFFVEGGNHALRTGRQAGTIDVPFCQLDDQIANVSCRFSWAR